MENLREHINRLRKQYNGINLDEKTICPDPLLQFGMWMQDCVDKNTAEPNAMILATASRESIPSVRTVLLRDFSESGFTFFTNYNSRKGKEIDENPYGSVLFFWQELARQVRIEGKLEKVDPAISENYFKSRPEGNQLSAWVSPQSSPIENKLFLEENYKAFKQKYHDKEIPYPAFWGGYILKPTLYEFWQGQVNRLHDRIQYELNLETKAWKITRLAP